MQVDAGKLDVEQVYQHIVLLVQHFNKFGAFGISRWPEFGSKDVKLIRICINLSNLGARLRGCLLVGSHPH